MNEQHILSELRKIAFHFRVEPIGTSGDAARATSVARAILGMQDSFKNFVRIEALKSESFGKELQKNPRLLDAFLEQAELLLVDAKFGSFEAALAPDFSAIQTPIFEDKVLGWKKEKFETYKRAVLGGDYNDRNYIRKLGSTYSPEEKQAIYAPLFQAAGNGEGYRLEVWNDTFGKKVLRQPSPENISSYKAPRRSKPTPDYQMYQAYLTVKELPVGSKVSKSNIGDILYIEPVEHEVFPFVVDTIHYGETLYVLRRKLKSEVAFEEENYFITNEALGIEVWGNTREEAEEAFKFTFDALYKNYAVEKDENLAPSAQKIKNTLKNLVQKVHAA